MNFERTTLVLIANKSTLVHPLSPKIHHQQMEFRGFAFFKNELRKDF